MDEHKISKTTNKIKIVFLIFRGRQRIRTYIINNSTATQTTNEK